MRLLNPTRQAPGHNSVEAVALSYLDFMSGSLHMCRRIILKAVTLVTTVSPVALMILPVLAHAQGKSGTAPGRTTDGCLEGDNVVGG
jgi:hypothetical protein